ncbi:MAG: hypothetical protein IPI41_00140 [Flavobacteriales bacterium]|nr:hypothetical protein [Flavobacteriales bacterium]
MISGQSVCDSIVLCVGDLATLDVTFLSPEPAQITTPTASSLTLSSFVITSAIPGLAATISINILPTPADVGYPHHHRAGYRQWCAGDDLHAEHHRRSATRGHDHPGALDVCHNGAIVDMITLLGGNPPATGDWTDPNTNPHSGQFDPGVDVDGAYTYSVGQGSNCASSGTVTMTTIPSVNAGTDVAVAYCNDQGTDDLFLSIGGGPMTGGAWLYPNDAVFSGIIDPASDPAGAYQYIVTASAPCANDTAFVNVSIPSAVDPGTDAALTLCTDAVPLDMLGALGGTLKRPARGPIPMGKPSRAPLRPPWIRWARTRIQ